MKEMRRGTGSIITGIYTSIMVGLILFAIVGCSKEEAKWKDAREKHTINSLEDFIKDFPKSIHSDEARSEIIQQLETVLVDQPTLFRPSLIASVLSLRDQLSPLAINNFAVIMHASWLGKNGAEMFDMELVHPGTTVYVPRHMVVDNSKYFKNSCNTLGTVNYSNLLADKGKLCGEEKCAPKMIATPLLGSQGGGETVPSPILVFCSRSTSSQNNVVKLKAALDYNLGMIGRFEGSPGPFPTVIRWE